MNSYISTAILLISLPDSWEVRDLSGNTLENLSRRGDYHAYWDGESSVFISGQGRDFYIAYLNPAAAQTAIGTIRGYRLSSGGGGGGGDATAANQVLQITELQALSTRVGLTNDSPAPSDTGTASLNGLLKRLLQRITVLIGLNATGKSFTKVAVNLTITSDVTAILRADPNRSVLFFTIPPGAPALLIDVTTPVSTTAPMLRTAPGGTNGQTVYFPSPVPTNAIYARTLSGTANNVTFTTA